MLQKTSFSLELIVVSITNFILVMAYCWISGWLIAKSKHRTVPWMWGIIALLIALSAFLAGINHGFFELSDSRLSNILYVATNISLGLTSFGISCVGCQYYIANRSIKKILLYLFLGIFIAYTLYILNLPKQNYWLTIVNYSLSLLFLTGLNAFYWREKGTMHINIFFILTVIASITQQSQLSLFNGLCDHNALYHLICVLAGISYFYIGKKWLQV